MGPLDPLRILLISSFWIDVLPPESPRDHWWEHWCLGETFHIHSHMGHVARYRIIGTDIGIWN